MMLNLPILAGLSSLLLGALAIPMHPPPAPPIVRNHCTVDFHGVGISITDSSSEWSAQHSQVLVGSFSFAPEWILQRVFVHGREDYYISSINDTNQVVSIDPKDDSLILEHKNGQIHQQWKVECKVCGSNPQNSRGGVFNEGCNIKNAGSGLCVQTPEGFDVLNKEPFFLEICTGLSFGRQNYDMHTPPPKPVN